MNATAEEPEAQSYVADRGGLRSSRADTRTPVPPWPHASTMIQWRQPSARAWLRLDWFASADVDCNECLQNMTSGKCQKTADTSRRSHDHTLSQGTNQARRGSHTNAKVEAYGRVW